MTGRTVLSVKGFALLYGMARGLTNALTTSISWSVRVFIIE
jgi:hypothetical protein